MKIAIRKPLCFSEIGRKDNQEDFLWPDSNVVNTDSRVFVMCDGVGGQDSGEVASATAATALGNYLISHPAENGIVSKGMFEEALAYAYDELDKVDTGALRKMGTTMTCVVLHRGGALVAHIGDSRIYHLRPSLANEDGRTGIIYQSEDHSLVNDLLRAGEITAEEAVNFPQKNVITRAMQPHLERRYKADIYNIDDIQSGDYFFLCCDGVLEQLTNEKLGAILADTSLDDAAKLTAIKGVCDNNTRDNYTCWLIPVDEVEQENTILGIEDEAVVAAVETEKPVVITEVTKAESPQMEEICIQPINVKLRPKFIKWLLTAVALCLLGLSVLVVKTLVPEKPDEEKLIKKQWSEQEHKVDSVKNEITENQERTDTTGVNVNHGE